MSRRPETVAEYVLSVPAIPHVPPKPTRSILPLTLPSGPERNSAVPSLGKQMHAVIPARAFHPFSPVAAIVESGRSE